MGEIKSCKLVSNNICYGPVPELTAEVEQHLTVSSAGRVWFSAKNYKQYLEGKGFCRKKQINIGSWKAEYLINLISGIQETDFVTDCGEFELFLRYDSGNAKRICGSLAGDITATSYGSKPVSLTKILRRYIPIYALWGFNGSLSPDYEGKKAIFLFAKKWEQFFLSDMPSELEFEENFGEACISLGFQMDCGKEFSRLYPDCFYTDDNALHKTIESIRDVDLLGSAVFSQWRYLTHWAYSMELNHKTCDWFATALRQMRNLTEKKV